ncbi:MAG TPA: hypothetical protein VM009_01680, partial [Terriglobales bacterium]|nr:hypothetical protein [Terriglobales bacterium]
NIFTEGLKGNIPTVRFNFENPGLRPPAYEITVEATGDAEYSARDEESTDPSTGTRRKFQVTKATRDRIFELTANLKQFRGDYEFRKHKVAFSGHKTLTYTEGAEEYSTKFNWSENKDITELAGIFQGIATTIQSEAQLLYLRKHDRLGLDAQLKSMESQAKSGWLKEIRIISKVLNEIKNDGSVMRMARERAERLLRLAGN